MRRCRGRAGKGWRVSGVHTTVAVHIHSICSANGDVVEQAEAVRPMWVILARDDPGRPSVMSWRPDRAEHVASLHYTASSCPDTQLCTADALAWANFAAWPRTSHIWKVCRSADMLEVPDPACCNDESTLFQGCFLRRNQNAVCRLIAGDVPRLSIAARGFWVTHRSANAVTACPKAQYTASSGVRTCFVTTASTAWHTDPAAASAAAKVPLDMAVSPSR